MLGHTSQFEFRIRVNLIYPSGHVRCMSIENASVHPATETQLQFEKSPGSQWGNLKVTDPPTPPPPPRLSAVSLPPPFVLVAAKDRGGGEGTVGSTTPELQLNSNHKLPPTAGELDVRFPPQQQQRILTARYKTCYRSKNIDNSSIIEWCDTYKL